MLSKDGETEVGKISKQWTGFIREGYTDADNFGATFPMDLDVKMKAVLLGAVFLIVIDITDTVLSVVFRTKFIIIILLEYRISCILRKMILAWIDKKKYAIN